MAKPPLRRLVRAVGKKADFWDLYLYVASAGFAISSGSGSGPGAVERTDRTAFTSRADARQEAERRIAEKVAEGYVEITDAPWHGGFDSPLRRSLEDALVEDPDDVASHMAYADHLVELGDPRGELIQAQLALEDEAVKGNERRKFKRREAALLKRYERAWLGPLAGFWVDKLDDRDGFSQCDFPHRHAWRRGWIDALWFYDGWGGVPAALAWTPGLRCLRELRLVAGNYEADHHGYGDLAGAGFLGNVRVLQIGGTEHDQNHFRDTAHAADFYRRMPRLEELYVHNGDNPFADPFPHLRRLTVYHGRYPYPMEALANNASLKNLTHLALWPRSRYNEYHWEAGLNEDGGLARISRSGAAALLRSPNFPNLQHLQLRNSDLGDPGVRLLIETNLLKRLRTLDLLGGCVTDEGARLLAACPDLRRLEALNLSHNLLGAAGIAALRATGVNLTAENQHGPAALATGEYLYEGDHE